MPHFDIYQLAAYIVECGGVSSTLSALCCGITLGLLWLNIVGVILRAK